MCPARLRMRLPPARGFTLVEVLVALAILSVIAVMTWRGIDIMTTAQQRTQAYTDDVLTLQAGLQQWQADLDAMMTWPLADDAAATAARSLAWDGRVLRITRAATANEAAGVSVVAWSRNSSSGAWRRWQSEPVKTQSAWYAAWQAAERWAESGAPEAGPDGRSISGASNAVTIAYASEWRLHYFQRDAWINPLSSTADGSDTGQDVELQPLPDAVRLLISLAPGQAIAGAVTLDWVSPDLGGAR